MWAAFLRALEVFPMSPLLTPQWAREQRTPGPWWAKMAERTTSPMEWYSSEERNVILCCRWNIISLLLLASLPDLRIKLHLFLNSLCLIRFFFMVIVLFVYPSLVISVSLVIFFTKIEKVYKPSYIFVLEKFLLYWQIILRKLKEWRKFCISFNID